MNDKFFNAWLAPVARARGWQPELVVCCWLPAGWPPKPSPVNWVVRHRGCGNGAGASPGSASTDWGIGRVAVARRIFPPEERHEILSMACSPRAELWGLRTHWAVRALTQAAVAWGLIRSVSKSTVHRWLDQALLKPHRVRRWLHSPDPDFRRKVRRIVRLYVCPPRGVRVICADEKTQQQILERVHPARPMARGQPVRLEQTYRRHGVLAILAGLDVRTGRVVVRVRRRRRQQEFLELLRALRRRWPRGRLVIVVDNLSIHTPPKVRAWVAAQAGRVRLEFLPVHASWLNQIELWFSVLERQCLKRASLKVFTEMAVRIKRFTVHWNRFARPFRWTFKGYPLQR